MGRVVNALFTTRCNILICAGQDRGCQQGNTIVHEPTNLSFAPQNPPSLSFSISNRQNCLRIIFLHRIVTTDSLLPSSSLSLSFEKIDESFQPEFQLQYFFVTMEKTMVEKRLGTESKNSKKRVIFLDRADRQSFFFFFFLLSNTYSYSVTLYIYIFYA